MRINQKNLLWPPNKIFIIARNCANITSSYLSKSEKRKMSPSHKSKSSVAVVGLGYVGLPLVLLASSKGHKVCGIDIQADKIDKLKKGIMPFSDDGLAKKLKATKANFSSDFKCVEDADIVIICVPTPVYENYLPNLEPIKAASKSVAEHSHKGQLIILESTVNPGISEEVVIPIFEEISKMKVGKDFHFAHCPERINPGDPKWNVENIPRVVGASDETGLKLAVGFYRSILTGDIKTMGALKEAEACKVVENSFRDINIAFVNELAQSFSRLGIDVVNVIEGASTKPFAFMAHYPGCGVGGHCIPVDPYYLIAYAKKNGFHHDFLTWARRINNSMPEFTVEMLAEGLNDVKKSIKGSKIVVLGLSYKPNIDDCRESPSFKIIKLLEGKNAKIVSFDPYVLKKSSAKSLKQALTGADAVIITTAHKQFRELTPAHFKKYGVKVVVDGRNCLDKKSFEKSKIVYKGIGR